MPNLAALRAAILFAIWEKPMGGGGADMCPPGRARVKSMGILVIFSLDFLEIGTKNFL